mmetsp:Transcript_20796/g.48235  ORF Transcript_20796/g.48235 Transcript_20796/m.48235 type:complete len:226 (-) Transcript_20796:108-785(-)
MAINPTLAKDDAGNLFPIPMSGETWLLKRDDINFECKVPSGGKLSGSGCFYLSGKRIVFIASGRSSRQDFKAFDIPLKLLLRETVKFQQPIFGANYLEGQITGENLDASSPLAGGYTSWSLTFRAGGCGTFLPIFYKLLHEIEASGEDNALTKAARQGRLNQVAFVDPSDPSTLFVTQPQAVPDSEERTDFQTDSASAPPQGAVGQNQPQGRAGGGGGGGDCVCS